MNLSIIFGEFYRMDGRDLFEQLRELKSKHPDPDSALNLFLQAKDIVNDGTKSNTERATAFYILNKCSFSGLTESSSFSKQASVSKLLNARN